MKPSFEMSKCIKLQNYHLINFLITRINYFISIEQDSKDSGTWLGVLGLPITGYVTLGKSLIVF